MDETSLRRQVGQDVPREGALGAIALLGPSRCGKTTALRAVAGLLVP